MKKINSIIRGILLGATIAGAVNFSYSAPVDSSDALQEARQFLTSGPSGIKRMPANAALTQAFVAQKDGKNLYYVFNSAEGFVIVSADDRLPSVLGYSDAGQFDEARIPYNMKEWLKSYEGEISEFISHAPETGASGRMVRSNIKREAIAPLVTTKWNQTSPYNLLCPTDAQGRRCVTGCVATAQAQIMRYHQWPTKPTGSSGGVNFDGTTYVWRQMIDDYETTEYTALQAQSVATLMRQCGASVNMNYSAWASGAYNFDVQYALPVYFKYANDLKMYWKDYVPQKEWSQLIYEELQAKRPVFYSGQSSEGGHAFVCDGYSGNEYFHFNWGWGGYEDGYFLLTALNPASGGAGSYEAGYTSHQSIIIGIRPGEGSAQPTQTAMLATGGFYYTSGNSYNIQNDPELSNVIYNPVGYEQTVQFALKIVDINKSDAAPVYVNCGSAVKIASGYGVRTLTSNSVPSLADGEYDIIPVYNTTAHPEWTDVQVPIGYQNFVRLSVKGGKLTYNNLGPDESNVAHLIFGAPETMEKNYGNLGVAVRVPVVNVGEGDFASEIGFTLTELDSEDPDASSVMATYSIPGGTSQNLEVAFTDELRPGNYLLQIMDLQGKMYSEKYEITLKDAEIETPVGDMRITDVSPSFMTFGKASPIYFTISNSSILSQEMNFTINIYDDITLEKIKTMPLSYSLTVPGQYNGRVNVRPTDLQLEPGNYLWSLATTEGENLCKPIPLMVTSEVMESDGISYVETSHAKNEALIVAPEGDPYSGNIEVPSTVAGLTVKGLRNNAFTFATSPVVTLPSTVTTLSPGTFYLNRNLKDVIFETTEIVPYEDEIFNPSDVKNIRINASQEIINEWMNTSGWKSFSSPCWYYSLTDVELTGLDVDPATGKPYAPYRVNYLTPLTIGFTAPAGKNVAITAIVNGEWFMSVIDPLTMTYELPALGLGGNGQLRANATTDAVGINEIVQDEIGKPIYTVDGRIVSYYATREQIDALPRGIYIIGSKKIIR